MKKKWVWVVMALVIFFVGSFALILVKTSQTRKEAARLFTASDPFESASLFVQTQSIPEKWLVVRDDPEEMLRAQAIIEPYVERFLTEFENPEVRELKMLFAHNFYISHLRTPSHSVVLGASPETPSPNKLEIVLYGRHTQNDPKIKGVAFYDPEWNAIFIPAMETSEIGIYEYLAHYLTHAKYGKGSPMGSEGSIREELEALSAEYAALNEWSGGKYADRLTGIVRAKPSSSLDEFLKRLSAEDLATLNDIFPKASTMETAQRSFQFLTALVFEWGRENGKSAPNDKIEIFRMVFARTTF